MSTTVPAPGLTSAQSNLFGQIITGGMVERAVVASLELWMNDYLGQIERIETDADGQLIYAPDTLQRPAGIITHSSLEKWPEDQLPLIVVMTSGSNGKPERHADGNYRTAWTVAIAAIVSDVDPHGDGQAATRQMQLAYGAAIRAALLQHKMLKSPLYPAGFASGLYWEDESYTDIPELQSRSMGSARITFSVAVDNTVTEFAGPRQPFITAGDDPGNWPSGDIEPPTVTPIGIEDTP